MTFLGDLVGVTRSAGRARPHVFLEKELERLGRDAAFAAEIFAAVTLESHASLLIQLVDVVVGAVRHAEARRRGYRKGPARPRLQSPTRCWRY